VHDQVNWAVGFFRRYRLQARDTIGHMTDIDANVLAPVLIYETCRKLLVSIRNIRPVIGFGADGSEDGSRANGIGVLAV
jgi:hypothetical protein